MIASAEHMSLEPPTPIQTPIVLSNSQKVLALREGDPTLPAIRIAEILLITRERVRQILKKAGLPTYIPRTYGFCKACGASKSTYRKVYCSAACRFAHSKITFQCEFCDNSKTIGRSSYDAQVRRGYKHMYCSVGCRQRGNWAFRKQDQAQHLT
jgi:hypothetical protein